MSRRTKFNLALLTVVLLLATIAYLTPETDDLEQPVPLTAINPADINRIEIRGQLGRRIALEKQGADWTMTSPYRARADATRIYGLSHLASTHSYLRVAAGDLDLGAYGLAAPVAVVQLNGTELVFGSTEPVHHRRYVLVEGWINLIDDGFYHHLMAQPEGFVATPSAQNPKGTPVQELTTKSPMAHRLLNENAK